MKQLRLFFPFVFPLCITFPSPSGGSNNTLVEMEKQIEELAARVKALEDQNQAQAEIDKYNARTSS